MFIKTIPKDNKHPPVTRERKLNERFPQPPRKSVFASGSWAISDGSRHFEPWSNDGDNTRAFKSFSQLPQNTSEKTEPRHIKHELVPLQRHRDSIVQIENIVRQAKNILLDAQGDTAHTQNPSSDIRICDNKVVVVKKGLTRLTTRADVGVTIVPQTISRHLAQANLKSKRPFRALPLKREHRQLRLQWCQARSMWNVTYWQKVVFSDESWFVLGTDDNRVRVWRCPSKRYTSPHTVLRHTAHAAGVMVWRAIAYDSRSTLIVMRGTLTGQRYVDDILRPHVGSFLNGLSGAIFQQDNARPHTARVAQDFLRHFQTLPWPARSPNLSPVEHVWDQLKRQMPSCHSVHDLELAVQDLWAHLPQDNIRCLINSMQDRVAACIAAGGGPTHC
ncbi:transposable element Tc1 transposase [Trichonephila clavipes]|nr:transposable element Tc1 transposase [Trichonephila clavipes]